jgi:hypothetical protein
MMNTVLDALTACCDKGRISCISGEKGIECELNKCAKSLVSLSGDDFISLTLNHEP